MWDIEAPYTQEVYFKDGTIEVNTFGSYNEWYQRGSNSKGLINGPTQYDGEGGAYQTIMFDATAEGYSLFNQYGICSTHQGTIGGHDTRLIFDYTHLKLWRNIYSDSDERLKEFIEIEKEYMDKIFPLRTK